MRGLLPLTEPVEAVRRAGAAAGGGTDTDTRDAPTLGPQMCPAAPQQLHEQTLLAGRLPALQGQQGGAIGRLRVG